MFISFSKGLDSTSVVNIFNNTTTLFSFRNMFQEQVEEQGIAQYARSPDRVIPGDAAKD